MALNPPSLATAFIAPNLIGMNNIGAGVPEFSLGIAVGVCQYLTVQSKVLTVDVGTAGVGTSIFPLIVPSPLVVTSLTAGFVGEGILGMMAPSLLAGLATGLTTGWAALAMLQTNHPTVGVGAGVAKIVGPSALPAMILGLSSVGMVGDGPSKIARAIGTGLDMTFASFMQLGVPIVGSPSPVASTGAGFGTVI